MGWWAVAVATLSRSLLSMSSITCASVSRTRRASGSTMMMTHGSSSGQKWQRLSLSCQLPEARPRPRLACALAESSRISTLRSLTHRRLLGKDFDSVKEKCIAGRLHPQLLFYESR